MYSNVNRAAGTSWSLLACEPNLLYSLPVWNVRQEGQTEDKKKKLFKPTQKPPKKILTSPTVKRGVVSMTLWSCFSSSGTESVVEFHSKYQAVLAQNLQPLKKNVTAQHNTDPKLESKSTKERLQKMISILRQPNQTPLKNLNLSIKKTCAMIQSEFESTDSKHVHKEEKNEIAES